ncbi:phosphatase PAP2 family protein [Actinomycetota bacterium]
MTTQLHPQTARAHATPATALETHTPALALAAAATFGVGLLYAALVATLRGQALDTGLMSRIAAYHPDLHAVAELALSGPSLAALALAAGVGVLVQAVRSGWRAALVSVGIILATFVSAELLKHGLPRPSLGGHSMINSFPSGHTAAIAGICSALVVATRRSQARWLTVPVAAVIAVGGGLSTVVTGWHRPSDAAASVLLGIAWGALGTLALRGRDRDRSRAGS